MTLRITKDSELRQKMKRMAGGRRVTSMAFIQVTLPTPPHVDYPQRNSHGKWQIGEIELDSEADREYINSMLEFQEMMKSLSNTDNNNAAHHS